MIKKIAKWLGGCLLLLLAYLMLWPVPIDPVAWDAPETEGYVGVYASNNKLAALKFLDIGEHVGPEDVAIGPEGMIYAAVHDGVIIRLKPDGSGLEDFANTGGRPLGIEFGENGTLYVADAYRGLLTIDSDGNVTVLANKADDGSEIKYADDLDVTSDGTVYFSDASTKFGAKEYSGTLQGSLLDLMEHGPNGRILKYDPNTGRTSIVVDGYSFANGVALANDESFLMFTETGTYSLHKLWLGGDKAGKVETLLSNMPGFPDNINNNADGTFWMGLVSKRSPPVDALSRKPFIRKIVQRLPAFMRPKPIRYGFVMRVDGDGKVLETLQGPDGDYALTTGAVDLPGGGVVVSSLSEPRLGVLE